MCEGDKAFSLLPSPFISSCLPHERPVYYEGAIMREEERNSEVLECPLGIKDNY
jgi:hypothetical protein